MGSAWRQTGEGFQGLPQWGRTKARQTWGRKREEARHPGEGQGSPNCWMARSALQGSSSVMCTRRRWFWTRRSAWRETPELEASEMMATSWGDADGSGWRGGWRSSLTLSRTYALGHPDVPHSKLRKPSIWGWVVATWA